MRQHQHRSIDLVQRGAFVHRNVVGLVTLDLVLRVVRAGVMGVTLVVSVLLVHLDDLATYVARLRVPAHVIPDVEFRGHVNNSPGEWRYQDSNALARAQTLSTVNPYSRSTVSPAPPNRPARGPPPEEDRWRPPTRCVAEHVGPATHALRRRISAAIQRR